MRKALWGLLVVVVIASAGCEPLGTLLGPAQKTVFVGPEKVDCEGEGPQTCYLVREDPDQQYDLFYDEIEGLEFQPGYEYEIVVSEVRVDDPPAGGSAMEWQLEEVIDKRPVAGIAASGPEGESGSARQADESIAEEVTGQEAVQAIEFTPVVMDDLGISTIVPSGWPRIEDDPLLPDAWGPAEYRFVAFHTVPGDDVEAAMAQLLSTTVGDLEAGSIDGEYWQDEIGEHQWAMYALENPSLDLVQTVSMTEKSGTVYVVSLFVKTAQKDPILLPVLRNFVISDDEAAEQDQGGPTVADGDGADDHEVATELLDTDWILTAYDDGQGMIFEVLPGSEIRARFTEDGRVSGSAGCNEYVSLFTVEGGDLTISVPALTREECADPPGIMSMETAYLADLTQVVSYEIGNGELQLLDEAGEVLLLYRSS